MSRLTVTHASAPEGSRAPRNACRRVAPDRRSWTDDGPDLPDRDGECAVGSRPARGDGAAALPAWRCAPRSSRSRRTSPGGRASSRTAAAAASSTGPSRPWRHSSTAGPAELEALPLDLVVRSPWDEAVLRPGPPDRLGRGHELWPRRAGDRPAGRGPGRRRRGRTEPDRPRDPVPPRARGRRLDRRVRRRLVREPRGAARHQARAAPARGGRPAGA